MSTDTVKSWIEETRTLTATGKSQGEYTVAAVTSLRRLPRALDALNAVLELHRRAVDIFEPSEFCAACSTDQRTVEYPCPTVQAIEGAIND